MAESSLCSGSPDPEISSLKEALRAHQQLLQKLYAELEEEREASASAASEALSVILRIQGEKAAVKMEANQYKRIAEEKMCYFEESVAIFEDLICQKELEIAALEYQVQSYRCRLLSIGFGELGLNEKVRTVKSLPPIHLKDSYLKKNSLEMGKSLLPMSDFVPDVVKQAADQDCYDQSYGFEKKSGSFSFENYDYFLEQVVKSEYGGKEAIGCDFYQVNLYENKDLSGLSEIQDVCEVPPAINACESKDQTKPIFEGEIRTRVEGEKKKKELLLQKCENITTRSKERENVKDYVELEQLFHRFEQLEAEKYSRRQEISGEELKVLKQIHQKLDFVQSEMASRRHEKACHQLEFTLLSLTEVKKPQNVCSLSMLRNRLVGGAHSCFDLVN